MRTAIRAASAGILVASVAGVLVVQYLWRPAVGADGSMLASILGWSPNLITGIGFPFLWVVVRGRGRPAPDRTRFAWFALAGFVILLNHEYWRPHFDWVDIAATAAGVMLAWLLYSAIWARLVSGPGSAVSATVAPNGTSPRRAPEPLRVESR
ncbi:MAG: hypothetical protein H0X64_08745 [Gemmatimonadaceae bacterium]|nr:hypothetical protein [Gemmatimonadaceae bacterium]